MDDRDDEGESGEEEVVVGEAAAPVINISTTVILHPGSTSVVYGMATDLFPQSVPNVIARRLRPLPPELQKYVRPAGVPVPAPETEETITANREALELITAELTEAREGKYRDMRKAFAGLKEEKRLPTGPEPLDDEDQFEYLTAAQMTETIVGADVLRLPPDAPYSIHWPFEYSHINQLRGQSMELCVLNLTSIFRHIVHDLMKLPPEALASHRVVILVPDYFDRRDVFTFVDILFALGFGHVMTYQDSVCATFGAGLSMGCVVDIGATKIAISCVEDGRVVRKSRMRMPFGGNDLDKLLARLMGDFIVSPSLFPSPVQAARALRSIKENVCHLYLTVEEPRVAEVRVRVPGRNVDVYKVWAQDSAAKTPLALFYPNALLPMVPYVPRLPDAADVFDDTYLDETREKKEKGAEDKDKEKDKELREKEGEYLVLGLAEAVFQSITSVGRVETKKRLFATTLLVGGGGSIPGLGDLLQRKIMAMTPASLEIDRHEVISNAKEMDPRFIAWKGGTVACRLESAQGFFITAAEFRSNGPLYVRVKAPFKL